MKQGTLALFILLLAGPLVLLGWLGQRSLTQDRIVLEHQAQELAESRLREAQGLVHGFIRDLQHSSTTALAFLQIENAVTNDHISLIREAVRVDPFLEQIFIVDADGIVQFPQDTEDYSNGERRFLVTLEPVLADENAFRLRSAREDSNNSLTERGRDKRVFSSVDRSSKIEQAISHVQKGETEKVQSQIGWTNWDTGTTTDTYLWQRTENGILIGQKLSSAYWLSQLIAELPSSGETSNLPNAGIRLVNKRQRVIYRWGNYHYEIGQQEVEGQTMPVAKEWLTYPLDGWRLEYFAPRQTTKDVKTLIFILSFLIIALLVGLGGWIMWREYQRDVRDAEQRVNFVNQVSHELKTPLTNICIYADMLEAEVLHADVHNQQRMQKFTKIVTSESKRLARLINNVLNFSRAKQQKMTVHKHPASVDAVILSTLDHFVAAFENKNIIIETTLNNDKMVMLDSELLEQVLNNLLSNIEKYAGQGRVARVSSQIENNLSSITLSDAGPGISRALRATVFEPFERGSDAITEGVSGTGIGLGIARDLCRLHGGDLQLIDSERGACFRATLLTEEVL